MNTGTKEQINHIGRLMRQVEKDSIEAAKELERIMVEASKAIDDFAAACRQVDFKKGG